MRMLDLFCGAGGVAEGYHRAGFEVVGVDIEPQPNYPFEFHQLEALGALQDYLDEGDGSFDAFHASCPCQFATDYKRRPGHVKESPNLIPQTRRLLRRTGKPYVIENVERARDHLIDPIRICGTSFPELDVQRHRLFESNIPLVGTRCDHNAREPRYPGATNRKPNSRRTVEVGVWRIPLETQQRAMGIDWMDLEELSEAIPPAYTEHIGHQLIAHLRWLNAEHDTIEKEAA